MKYLFAALLAVAAFTATAQAPPGISYQAVIRDADDFALANAEVVVRIAILANSETGTLMWEEDHLVETDAFGLFDLVIGQGTTTGAGNSTAFANINWGAANYFLRVQVEAGNGVFELLGNSQLLSVPYAFYAGQSASGGGATISDFSLSEQTLTITEDGQSFSVDLSDLLASTVAGTSINLVQLVGTDLNIVEGANAFVVDLSPLIQNSGWTLTDTAILADPLPVGIGTANPQSTLHVNGSVSYTVQLLEGPINAIIDGSNNVILANVSTGPVTLNLPAANTCTGRVYTIKRQGPSLTNTLTINSGGGQIEAQANYVLSGPNKEVVQLISDGLNWWIIAQNTIN